MRTLRRSTFIWRYRLNVNTPIVAVDDMSSKNVSANVRNVPVMTAGIGEPKQAFGGVTGRQRVVRVMDGPRNLRLPVGIVDGPSQGSKRVLRRVTARIACPAS